jgi:hypothetical protein
MESTPENIDNSELRQSLEHLLQTDFLALHEDIKQLRLRIHNLETLSNPLPEDIHHLEESIQELMIKSDQIEHTISLLQNNLTEPQQVTDLVRLGLSSALQKEINTKTTHYSEIIAPIISPAISNQIRNARPEMIAALYPIIGQTINKAISEAMQDLRRRIDANLKRNLNFSQRIYRFQARMKGISTNDLILRESLDYKITYAFLIHRETGLLIKQVSSTEEAQDMDIFSAMLTAIRDFAHDAFGSSEEELEEIQYGTSHILLRNGLYSYLAVVIGGVQPSGYASLMLNTIHQINMKYGEELSHFSGEMGHLHDYREDLLPLFHPSSQEPENISSQETLSHGQKVAIGSGIIGVLLLIALTIFACVFTIRLLPVAFPAPTQTFTPFPTQIPPTVTLLPTHSPTMTLTPTSTPTMTFTPTLSPSPTIQDLPKGIMTGNVWVRLDPIPSSKFNPSVVLINTPVEIIAIYDKWAKISWNTEFGHEEGWVPALWIALPKNIPSQIITPGK